MPFCQIVDLTKQCSTLTTTLANLTEEKEFLTSREAKRSQMLQRVNVFWNLSCPFLLS